MKPRILPRGITSAQFAKIHLDHPLFLFSMWKGTHDKEPVDITLHGFRIIWNPTKYEDPKQTALNI